LSYLAAFNRQGLFQFRPNQKYWEVTAMYGTIYRIKIKPGKLAQVLDQFKSWEATQLPQASGVIAS
jgi:hypothetical protein